jgi:hypothetical protein
MPKSAVPPPPAGAGASGRALWSAVHAEFELDQHEVALLVEAVRTMAVLDQLDAAVQRDGTLIETPSGRLRAHPATVEARQQKIALARILSAIRLPFGTEVGEGRPQRRVGVRQPYRLRGLPS